MQSLVPSILAASLLRSPQAFVLSRQLPRLSVVGTVFTIFVQKKIVLTIDRVVFQDV